MKTILLAAAAIIAVPAIAQTTTTGTTTPTPDQSATMQNDQTMPAQSGQMQSQDGQTASPTGQMPMQSGQSTPNAQTTGTPMGGYSPAQPAMNGTPMPGQTVTYQQAPDPSTAFPPPPAPTGTLPYCKKGQYDNCREHSTASGARSHRTKR